jgi:aspartyl-tRNA(Asn)/glutamyl-tRNA(Gln) amidotransferase subunit A
VPAELWTHGIRVLARELRAGTFSAPELTGAYLERISAVNPSLNAIVTLDEEGALRAAARSQQLLRSASPRSLLEGIPFTVKDNIFVAGMRCTFGSLLYRDHVCREDDISVSRLRDAGSVILGKTNTPEFALSGFTDNRVFGATLNPWNTSLTPGGSSGGAVAAVAAGLCAAALATDAGGSTRRPASHTGLVGFKPSVGRIPRRHGFPALTADFQSIGVITRTVDDLALVMDCVAGADPADRSSLLLAVPAATTRSRPFRRVSVIGQVPGTPVEPECAAAVALAGRVLAGLGLEVGSADAPWDVDEVAALFSTISAVGLARVVQTHADWRDRVMEHYVPLIEQGLTTPAVSYVLALDRVAALRREIGVYFSEDTLVLTPTSSALPWPAGEPFPRTIAGKDAGPRAAAVFTTVFNLSGHPAISLPVTLSADGLPVGVQLVAPFGADAALLEAARSFEDAAPWEHPWPPVMPASR